MRDLPIWPRQPVTLREMVDFAENEAAGAARRAQVARLEGGHVKSAKAAAEARHRAEQAEYWRERMRRNPDQADRPLTIGENAMRLTHERGTPSPC